MTRTIVDIEEENIKALDSLGKKRKMSRAALVRRGVELVLQEAREEDSEDLLEKCFGILKDDPNAFDGLDAVEYQHKMRDEWEDPSDQSIKMLVSYT